jgi:hypothetical protein
MTNEAKYTVEVTRDTFTGVETETIREVPESMVQTARDLAKLNSNPGDTVTIKVY